MWPTDQQSSAYGGAPDRGVWRGGGDDGEPRLGAGCDRLQRGVARRGAHGQVPERRSNTLLGDASRRHHLDHAQRRLRERPRLVKTNRVHGGQGLDRVELLGKHAVTGHAHGSCRVGDTYQQHEALRNQAHHPGDRCRDRRVQMHVTVIERVAQDSAQPEHQHYQRVQQRFTSGSSGERGWRFRVRDDDAEEQSVARVTEDQRHRAEPREDHVEHRQRVRAHDARVRATRPLPPLTTGSVQSALRLGLAQTAKGVAAGRRCGQRGGLQRHGLPDRSPRSSS
jgi:hypothetical protein